MSGDRLDRFLTAQDRVWSDVTRELTAGYKTSHWMWFVFPQLAGLGRSETSRHYAIADLDEAQTYLAHPILRFRLAGAAQLMLMHIEATAEDILGGIDAAKLRSSMTLFERVEGAPEEFGLVLDRFYRGQRCPLTLRLLDAALGGRP